MAGSAAQTLPHHRTQLPAREHTCVYNLLWVSHPPASKRPLGEGDQGGVNLGPGLGVGRPQALPSLPTRGHTSKRWELTFFPFFIHVIRGLGSPVAWHTKEATPPDSPVWSSGTLMKTGLPGEKKRHQVTRVQSLQTRSTLGGSHGDGGSSKEDV